MNEKQFLEMSDRERDGVIRVHVYLKPPKVVEYWITHSDLDRENDENYVPRYTTTWEGMGLGIEHAKANFYDVELHIPREGFYRKGVVYRVTGNMFSAWTTESIFLAFWIAYLKALGVLE